MRWVNRKKTVRVSLLWRILVATLIAGLVPLLLLAYNAIQSAHTANDAATAKATEGLDNKSLDALKLQAIETSQSISDLLNTTVQNTRALALLPRDPQIYQTYIHMHQGAITYPDGSTEGKQLTIPDYREMAFIDRTGQEIIKVTDGKIVPPSDLRNVSDPANTTYKTETYFADTKVLPRDGVYVSRVTAWHSTVPNEPNYQTGTCNATGSKYTTYEGIIRFATPVFDPQGQFDGIVMLALDHRLIMDSVVHIIPSSEVQSVPWPNYDSGNYAYIWDDQGYLIAHPRLNGTRGVDANGQLVAQWPKDIKAEDQCHYLFNMMIGSAPAPKMYADTQKGLTSIEFNVSRAGTRKANIYTPIFFNYGVYSKTNIFGGLVIGANVDEFHKAANEVRASLDAEQGRFQTNIFYITLAAIVLLGVIGILISRSITRPVSRLNIAARKVEDGKEDLTILDDVVSRNIRDEVSDLADVFKQMAGTVQERERELKVSRDQLEDYNIKLEDLVLKRTGQLQQANEEITGLNERLRADNLRLKAEIEITRQLQQMILPKDQELNQIVGLEISGFMLPADEVGGDYYDVLQENGRVKIGIGDVTGHGLESGVLMIMVQTAVRTLLAADELDPARYLGVLNRAIYENVQRMRSDKNLTLSLLDYEDGKIRLSGQHEETIIVRHDGSLELIDTINLGFPIGLEADITGFVSEVNLHLNPGDIVVLYTDGIPEAENEEGVQYGLERLCQVIQENHNLSAPELKKAIIDDLIGFIGKQKVYDDITLLVLKQKEVAQPCEAALLN